MPFSSVIYANSEDPEATPLDDAMRCCIHRAKLDTWGGEIQRHSSSKIEKLTKMHAISSEFWFAGHVASHGAFSIEGHIWNGTSTSYAKKVAGS